MKDFKNFLSEAREGVPSKDDIEKLQRMARPETSASSAKKISRSLSSQVERQGRKKRSVPSSRVISTPEGPIITNKPVGGTTPEEIISRAERRNPRGKTASSGDVTDYLGKQRDSGAKTSFDMEASAQRPTVRKTAGTEPRKPLKPGSYVVDTSKTPKADELKISSKYTPPGTGPRGSSISVDAPSSTPKVVKQSEVSQQAKTYRTAQGEKKYQATKLDQDVRRSFPTGKGGLKADETNPYVKRSVRQARSTRLGGDIFDAPSVGNRPFRALTKKTKTGTVITNIPDPFEGASVPKKTKKAGAPDRTLLKQAIADIRASKNNLTAQRLRRQGITDIGGDLVNRRGSLPNLINIKSPLSNLRNLRAARPGDVRVTMPTPKPPKTTKTTTTTPKAPPKIKRPKIGSGTASGYSVDNRPQPGSEVVKYTGAKAKGSSDISKGSALVKATKGDGIPDAMKRGAYDAAMKQRNVRRSLESVVGKYAQETSKQTAAMYDDLKKQQQAQQKSQRRQQAKVRLKGMKSAARVRGASGALGLGIAAYDAYQTYKQAKSQGSSDTRAALRGITKAAGGALAGGLAGAAGSALGGPLAGLAAGGAAYSYGADAAEKAFMAAAGPNKLKLADMARKNRLVQKGTSAADATFKMGNKAIIKDKQGKERIGYAAKLTDKQGNVKTVYKHGDSSQARKYTSSNAIERLGRNIPFLQGYYTRKDEADRVKKVADFKAKATGSK